MKQDLHLSQNPQTLIDQTWNDKSSCYLDVRSPNEFASGHIPGAINIPLLHNEEREIIGILYKNFGQKKAIEKGYEICEKKLDAFAEMFENIPKEKVLTVYCARGGMRSGVITSYLRYLGFEANQMKGGYKAFRNFNIQQIDETKFDYPIILHGKTGVGKTLLLHKLNNSLDLEGLADHRGSLFGGIGKSPVSQKSFEAGLLKSLNKLSLSKPVFIEGESRKVGDVSIPASLFQQMRNGIAVMIDASMNTRIERTVQEYVKCQPEELTKIRVVIGGLKKELGKKQVAEILDFFDKGKFHECTELLLTNYYDRKYAHSLKKLKFSKTISSENLNKACEETLAFAEDLVKD